MKRLFWLTAALAGTACSAGEPGHLPQDGRTVDVTVSTALELPAEESFPAVITSERVADVATRMSGTVERVFVDVGSRVAAGDALVRLDARDVDARVSAARAMEELAERSFRRVESLTSDGAASQHELDQARAGLEAARASRAEAEAQEAYAVVRSPFAGVVTRRSVDPGDLAVPGRPMITVMSPGALKVVADLPAHRAGTIAVGDPVRIRTGDMVPLVGRVARVVPALGEGGRTFRVEATLEGGANVTPGSYARIEVARVGSAARWIPADAVVTRGQLRGVYALEDGTLRLRWVRLGQERDGAYELLAGPAGALRVVRDPAPELADGTVVTGVTEAAWSVGGGVTRQEVVG
ncbi:MAG: efflux RND transporter periplasmic adaptor subunit [Gemmatimonadota bacterium]|nr:efflux RND transporter periplasmic adaptor subunit [Gemmatimonadota bacterium]